MNHRMGFAGTLAFFLALLSFAGFAAAAGPRSGDYVPGELLVKFKPGTRAAQKPFATGVRMRTHVRTFERLGIEHWKLPEGVDMQAVMDELRTSGAVEFVEPNYQRRLRNIRAVDCTQWALSDMGVPDAPVIEPSITVAVIDTGVQIEEPHPELAGALIKLESDPEDPTKLPPQQEPINLSDWHGTAVAAAIAGNGVGVANGVKVLPLQSDLRISSLLTLYHKLVAINENDNLADDIYILNASWGGPQFSMAESSGIEKLRDAGILVVAAAGNSEMDNDLVADYPSSLPLPNVLSVAASTETGGLVTWSHFGAASVDLAAPGEAIKVAVPVDRYACVDGTSFSAPHVAGIAARVASKIKSEGRNVTYQELKARILAGATDMGTRGFLVTDGRANTRAALDALPQPVIVYAGHSVADPQGNGNNVLEPGELAQLNVTVENLWEAASAVSVRLISGDSLFLVEGATANFGISSGDRKTVSFSVRLSPNVVGHRRIPLALEIDAGEASMTRYFNVQAGTLQYGSWSSAFIQQTAQDDMHIWTFHLRDALPSLQFDLEAAAGDLDLYVKRGGVPQFDSFSGDVAVGTWSSASSLSRESIQLQNAAAGVYHVAVFNWDPQFKNLRYSLRVSEAAPSVSSGGGGGGGEGAWLAALAFAGWFMRRMGRARSLWFAMPLLLAGCASAQEAPVAAPAANPALELLITVDDQADRSTVQRRLVQEGARILHVYEHVPVIHIVAPAGLDLEAAQARIVEIPGVIAVEPNVTRRLY